MCYVHYEFLVHLLSALSCTLYTLLPLPCYNYLVTIGSPVIPIFTVIWGSPSPFYRENGDPRGSLFSREGPHIPGRMGTRTPILPDKSGSHPHFPGKKGMGSPRFRGSPFSHDTGHPRPGTVRLLATTWTVSLDRHREIRDPATHAP